MILEVCARLLFRKGIPLGIQGIARDITARELAEGLERDRNRILELVASNEPLEEVLTGLCLLVERQCPEQVCSCFLEEQGGRLPGVSPCLPEEVIHMLAEAVRGAAPDACWPPASALALCPFPVPARDLLLSMGFKTGALVPVRSAQGRLLGRFLVLSRREAPDWPPCASILETAQRLAVVAIEHRQLTDELAFQARHDALTGLPNRCLLKERLEQALGDARRHGWMVAVLFLDLDRFKQINDTLGHAVGDVLLQQTARRLEACLRRSDSLARMGGDEFTVVLPELSDSRDVLQVAHKLLQAFADPFAVDCHELYLTASLGISLFPRDGGDAATLQRNADAAMSRAKNRGKNGLEFFTPELGAAALKRLEIENALRRALDHGELELRYQPQAAMDGVVAGFEALLVWNHPRSGTLPPAQFIPVAEDSGMIAPIGAWALAEACRQAAAWRTHGHGVRLAVNVSPTQFSRPDFVESVAQALAESGLDPEALELEMTEGVVMRYLEEAVRRMERLRALGVGISIDDFGTGYSSLSYLRRLPVNALKIDRSFLVELDRDPNTIPLLGAIVALAHGLGLKVVAEGVETRRQRESLAELGCDLFQGYLLGEPVGAAEAEELLRAAPGLWRLRT